MQVRLTRRAVLDLKDHRSVIASDSTDQADRWVEGIRLLMESLGSHSERFPLDDDYRDLEVRRVPFHSHRIYYKVMGGEVVVLRVWHMARRPPNPTDLSL